jgi:membrane-associated protease RseP (regulator of RpoE activity)
LVDFRVGQLPVRITVWFPLTLALAGLGLWRDPPSLGLWMLAAVSGVVLHELGHVIAFRLAGWRPRMELHAFGGATHGEGPPLGRGARVLSHLAGPAVGLALGGLIYLAQARHLLPARAALLAEFLLWVNLGWSGLNLLPIPPLDGGAALFAAVPGLGAREAVTAIAIFLCAVGALAGLYVAPGLLAFSMLLGIHNAGVLRALNQQSLPLRAARDLARPAVDADAPLNKLAVASAVCSAFCFLPGLSSVLALALGVVGLRQVRARGQRGASAAWMGIGLGGFNLLAHLMWLGKVLTD